MNTVELDMDYKQIYRVLPISLEKTLASLKRRLDREGIPYLKGSDFIGVYDEGVDTLNFELVETDRDSED